MTDKVLYETNNYTVERAVDKYNVRNKGTDMVEAEDRKLPHAIVVAQSLEEFLQEALAPKDEKVRDTQFVVPKP